MGEAAGKNGKPSAPGKDNKPGAAKENPNPPPSGQVIVPDNRPMPSAAERALLGRLSERRQELDKRARELDIREGLITEAEKRIDGKLSEIRQVKPNSLPPRKRRTKPKSPGSKVWSRCTRTGGHAGGGRF